MIKREELSSPNSCMSRAKDGEMTFVLLARDAAAPVAIRAWVAEHVRLGKNAIDDEQIKEALHCCGYMDQQRRDRIGMEESTIASPAPTPDERDDRQTSHALDVMAREGMVSAAPAPPACSEEGIIAETIRIDLANNALPIAKALLAMSRAMRYESLTLKDDSIIASLILEAEKELREAAPLSEADLARIAVRHFPVKLESQLGIVKKDVNAEARAACLAALREACGK